MASAEVTVDVLDKSTWAGVDYEPLLDIIHGRIAIQALQQQRYEQMVQTAALFASTNVQEDRRTWRGIARSCLIHPFNKKAVDAKRVKKGNRNIKRVEG